MWGCDSTVQLSFTMHLMTPLIEADIDHFDFNQFDVTLTDVSIGGERRTWYFPNGDPRTEPVVTYTAPSDIDSAVIFMVENSPYGCVDTAYITIPFHRNVIWVPNVFTPDDDGYNNHLFHSVSIHLLKQQTLIYNRRGELVFRCDEIDCPWDGNDMDGNPCPQGAYVYIIRYVTDYRPFTTEVEKGTVTLLR
jgi:gliding motility-associated-like protein